MKALDFLKKVEEIGLNENWNGTVYGSVKNGFAVYVDSEKIEISDEIASYLNGGTEALAMEFVGEIEKKTLRTFKFLPKRLAEEDKAQCEMYILWLAVFNPQNLKKLTNIYAEKITNKKDK